MVKAQSSSSIADVAFEPSFDEYLKAMESVKTVREKREKARKVVEDGELRDSKEKNNDNNGEIIPNPIKHQAVTLNKIGNGKFERWEKDKGNNGRFIRDEPIKRNERKIVFRGNERWKKEKDTYNPIRAEPTKGNQREIGCVENSRWEKDRGYIRNRVGDESFKVNERKIGNGKDKTSIAEKGKFNGWSYSDSIQDKSVINESKFGVESTRRSHMNGKSARWEGNRGNSSFVKDNDYSYKIDGDRIVHNSKRFDKYDQNVRWEQNHERGDSAKEKDRSFNNDRIGGSKLVLRNGKLSVNRAVVGESDEDEELGVERAAFKPMNGLDDIVDKPRITRNEMEERIQKLARCLNGADVNMPEWMFSKMIRSARIRFSDHSTLRIIQFLGKLGNWKRVLQLIDWLQSRERFKSHKLRHIYTTALGVLGKARRPVEALNLFHTMQQQFSTYPDLVAYHSIAVTLGQAGHMRELFDVIDIMKSPPKKKLRSGVLDKWDPRLEADIVVYNAVLNACVKRKQWEGAFWVLQQLKEKGQPPSGTTYGLVMEVMLACEKYNLVHDFYKKVLKSSIPNALTYKVLVNTLWREGKTDEAVLVVEDMERRGVVGSAALYYDLARCLCSAGRCREALIQVDKIVRVANKPLVVTYTGLMQACLDAGNIEDGAYIFKHMHKFCSPNLVTHNIMLKAYIEHKKFEEAKSLFRKLLEDGNCVSCREDYKDKVIPDKYSFNTMLDACVEEQDWDEFEVVYKGMLEYGYPVNAKRHLRMILDAGRAGKGELLETTWNHLIHNSQTPPPHQLVKEIFHMKLEQGDYSTALSYISTHHSNNLQAFSCNAWLKHFDENAHRLQKDNLPMLLNEIRFIKSENDTQQAVLQNLVLACREFLHTRMRVSLIT